MNRILTPEEVADAREELGFSVTMMADALRLAMPNGRTTIREWESGRRQISGPASVAIDCMLAIKDLLDVDPLIPLGEEERWQAARDRAEELILRGETT